MTEPAPRILRWAAWDGQGFDDCAVCDRPDGLTLDGIAMGRRGGAVAVHYRVWCDARGRTRAVQVDHPGGRTLHLSADGEGRWTDGATGRALPDLDGCLDVDIAATPATNALPIRRLWPPAAAAPPARHPAAPKGTPPGKPFPIRVVYIPRPAEGGGSPAPRPARQSYARLGPRLYRYESADSGFTAELAVDDGGFVLDYPGLFRRLPAVAP